MGEGSNGVGDDWHPLWEDGVDPWRGFTRLNKKKMGYQSTNGPTKRPTDGGTHPLIEIRERILKEILFPIAKANNSSTNKMKAQNNIVYIT